MPSPQASVRLSLSSVRPAPEGGAWATGAAGVAPTGSGADDAGWAGLVSGTVAWGAVVWGGVVSTAGVSGAIVSGAFVSGAFVSRPGAAASLLRCMAPMEGRRETSPGERDAGADGVPAAGVVADGVAAPRSVVAPGRGKAGAPDCERSRTLTRSDSDSRPASRPTRPSMKRRHCSRMRSSAATVAAGVTKGLPSRSAPIHDPKRSRGGTSNDSPG